MSRRSLDDIECYDSLYLRAGTGEGRTTLRGWAAWTRLWPAAIQDDVGSEEGQKDAPPTSFDVSDVDTTNFPEMDCYQMSYPEPCAFWSRNVERGIDGVVGVHSTSVVAGEGELYIQLKERPE